MFKLFQVFPDVFTKRELNFLRHLHCVNPGCSWRGAYQQLEVSRGETIWEHGRKVFPLSPQYFYQNPALVGRGRNKGGKRVKEVGNKSTRRKGRREDNG
jgi:hypothetical protein